MSGHSHGSGLPRLHIVYRSHGGENAKSRPPYYSKLLGLASVVRAVRESGVSPHVVYWNDGPIPGDRLEVMRATGEVVQIDGGSNRRSYRAALQMAARSEWDDADLVWLMEDDYLYQPQAFRMLAEGAAALPDADYLSMYGREALDVASPRRAPRGYGRLGAVDVPDPVHVGGATWFRGVSTTSTFGVRLGVLREDCALLRALPYTGGGWDHTTCLTVQGLQPFSWAEIREELLPVGELPVSQWPASVARGLVRTGVNLRSRRSPARCRRLYLCDPVCAVHVELSALACATDWSSVAADTRAWALGEGIPVATHEADASAGPGPGA
jgi:hypothetical protein